MDKKSKNIFFENIFFGRPVFPLDFSDIEQMKIIRPGRAEGRLLGGNLTMVVHMLAAGRLPDMDGAILFLEDTNEAPYRLDRMLTTLKQAGTLEKCSGIILGRFEYKDDPEPGLAVLEENLSDFPGPVVSGFPVGHGRRNLVLPLGPMAILDTASKTLDLAEPCLG